MIKIEVNYGSPFQSEWQKKSFKDENTAIMWIQRNHKRISCINDYRTEFKPISIFQIQDAIDGIER